MTDKIWNVAAYTRPSRDDGDKSESDSISSQKDMIREYLRDRADMVIVHEYVNDGGHQGKKGQMHYLQRLVPICQRLYRLWSVYREDFYFYGSSLHCNQ